MYDGQKTTNYKWAQQGSNLRPRSYELPALTAELWALAKRILPYLLILGKRKFIPFSYQFPLLKWKKITSAALPAITHCNPGRESSYTCPRAGGLVPE